MAEASLYASERLAVESSGAPIHMFRAPSSKRASWKTRRGFSVRKCEAGISHCLL